MKRNTFLKEPLVGIVLCGGESQRMGVDKAFIEYYTLPQYAYMSSLMKELVSDVFISCNHQQKDKIPNNFNCIIDKDTYGNAGPMSGVISAFEKISNAALLVVGCDYPMLCYEDLLGLLKAREESVDVVCYTNPNSGFDEPLLAIYEKQCAISLQTYFKKDNFSLRHYLKTVHTKRILPNDEKSIQSIDTPEEYIKWVKK
ncbi:MAG: molybdenum cofactor guanylyltransferase [Bacteroidetes bacterium]|nr:molybdenum cofactor guanylyltransferase [Bacteroidota bacterium]